VLEEEASSPFAILRKMISRESVAKIIQKAEF